MSNARNLANLLGTNTTIQTAKLADSSISTAKMATAVTSPIISGSVLFGQSIASGSITSDTGTLDIAFDPTTSKSTGCICVIFGCQTRNRYGFTKISAANTVVSNMSCYGGGAYQGEGVTGELQYSNIAYYNLLQVDDTVQVSASGAYRCKIVGHCHY